MVKSMKEEGERGRACWLMGLAPWVCSGGATNKSRQRGGGDKSRRSVRGEGTGGERPDPLVPLRRGVGRGPIRGLQGLMS